MPRYLPKDWSKPHEYDTLQDWLGARLYLLGKSPYSPEGLRELKTTVFGHPPTAPFWLIPIARLDEPVAAELMDFSTWFLLLVHVYVCARAVRFPSPIALSILMFGWALTLSGFVAHWHAIQSSEQIAFALVVSWLYLRRGQDAAAGAALGFAATLKLFPGLLFVLLLVGRRFRAFFAATAVFTGVAVVMTARFGFDAWRRFFVLQAPAAILWTGNVRNATIHGIVLRLMYPVCEFPWAGPTPAARAVGITTSVALLFIAIAVSRHAVARARDVDPRAIDAPFALFSVLAVLVNPWAWNHYWVLLIQPAFVVMDTLYAAFRSALADWLDEHGAGRRLAMESVGFALGILGIAVIVWLLGIQDMRAENLQELWVKKHTAWAHHQLHFYEVSIWLPWVIMLVLSAFAVRVSGRSAELRRELPVANRLTFQPEESPELATSLPRRPQIPGRHG